MDLNRTVEFLMIVPLVWLDKVSDLYETEHKTIIIEWESDKGKLSIELGQSNYSYFIKHEGEPILVDGNYPIDEDLFIKHLETLT